MMRNVKLLGIIALVAVMGLGMMACGPDDSGPSAEPPKAIFFLSADYGAYQSYPISATVREFEPPLGATIDIPTTAPYDSTKGVKDGVDILISWFDVTGDFYKAFVAASVPAKDKDGQDDPNAPRVPLVIADPNDSNDPVLVYEAYLKTVISTDYYNLTIDTSSNISPKGLLFKPNAVGKYVAGIADAAAFQEWYTYTQVAGETPPSIPKFLFSNEVELKSGSPTGASANYVGKWEMGYTFKPSGSGFTDGGYEVLKISDKTFRIFLSQKDEGIQFEISGWEPLSGGALTKVVPKIEGGVQNGTTQKVFGEGYKLTVGKTLLNLGYTDYDEFYVYREEETGTVTLYRTNGTKQGYAVVRSYSKRTEPSAISVTAAEDWTLTGAKAPAFGQ